MATTLLFQHGSDSLVFEAGSDYPLRRRTELLQVQDRTAGGKLQVENLGVSIRTRVLTFNLMSKVDYDNLINWFLNIVNGGELSFDYTDEYGITAEVVFADSVLDFTETSLNRYAGSFTLEYT